MLPRPPLLTLPPSLWDRTGTEPLTPENCFDNDKDWAMETVGHLVVWSELTVTRRPHPLFVPGHDIVSLFLLCGPTTESRGLSDSLLQPLESARNYGLKESMSEWDQEGTSVARMEETNCQTRRGEMRWHLTSTRWLFKKSQIVLFQDFFSLQYCYLSKVFNKPESVQNSSI